MKKQMTQWIVICACICAPLLSNAQERIIFEAANKLIMQMSDTIYIPQGIFTGYGTTEPLDPIHIVAEDDDEFAGFYAQGGANTRHVHYILDNRTGNGKRYSIVSVGDDSQIPNGSFAIRDLDVSEERLTIDPTGKIGINNNNPTEQLDVKGAIKTNRYIKIGAATAGGSAGSIQFKNGDFEGYAGGEWKSLTNATSTQKVMDDDEDTRIEAEETVDVDELKFYAKNKHLMTMKEDTIYVPQGVFSGYGTTNPLDPIHVVAEDDDEFSGFYAEGGTGTKHVHYILDNRTANGKRYSLVSVGDDSDIPNGSFAIRDLDTGDERLLIDATGDIGINTNNPSARLDVNGDLRIRENARISDTLFVDEALSMYGKATIEGDPGSDANLLIKTENDTAFSRIRFTDQAAVNTWNIVARPGPGPIEDIGRMSLGYNGSTKLSIYENNTVVVFDTMIVQDEIRINGIFRTGENGDGNAQLKVGNGINDQLIIGNDIIKDGGNNILRTTANFTPATDDNRNLGGSSFRWKNVWATNGTINTSDIRAKKNITTLSYGLKEVLQLRPVDFNWKNGNDSDTKTLGLIAQELSEVIPEVVVTPENAEQLYGVKYADLVPVLIQAIQELNAKVDALSSQ